MENCQIGCDNIAITTRKMQGIHKPCCVECATIVDFADGESEAPEKIEEIDVFTVDF